MLCSLSFVSFLKDNLLDLLKVNFEGFLWNTIRRLLRLLRLFLFFALNSNRLVLAFILSPLVLHSVLIEFEKFLNCGAFAHWRRQVTKRIT